MLFDNTILSLNDTQSAIKEFMSNISGLISLNDELEFKIKIILNELVTNSFIHAQSGTYVRILAKLQDGFISIAIIDDSKGFDYSKLHVMDICENSCLMQESGRGIHIVQLLSDALRYNRKGNIIAIKVNLV